MGNTELVINSRNQDPEDSDEGRLHHPLKVNEYVSWYLNGIIGRAEYPALNMQNEDSIRKLIDYSGPLKRLLSQDSQTLIRESEIDDAIDSTNCDPDRIPPDPECIRHNQIAGCVILPSNRVRCYPLGGLFTKIRLSHLNSQGIRHMTRLFSYVPFSSTEDRKGQVEIADYEIQPKEAAKARKAGAATPPPPPAAAPPDTFQIRIREIRVDGGRMNFSDYFVKPNFSADVQALNGTITGASSAYESKARVDLKGKLDDFSPVSIKGELQPFAFDHYTDLGLKFENISLPLFNPYSTPLAGYIIAKGKLTTDLHYTIGDRKLDAQHKIRIDQLEWGEATATQGEATLPVKFATSLLKDKDGVINLAVPVGGTLDDPSFRIGPIVWQVIKNIISCKKE